MVQLLIFDSRRGNREGEEMRKILAFYPADTPVVEQITLAGLLQGLLLFSANFSQVSWKLGCLLKRGLQTVQPGFLTRGLEIPSECDCRTAGRWPRLTRACG